ncbi:MAG: T9SS type A sorting domain-containing protein [Chitinophagaceae bacterium]|nr:MAG: T9SS type A sorting domain-containing protein [Chitinophagaceae bacterium]
MKSLLASILFLLSFLQTRSQVITPFSIRYQATQKGGIRYVSNTAVTCAAGGTCATSQAQVPPAGTAQNNNFNDAYVDIDSDASTFMSSSDSLALPGCTEISWAGLYWGGDITSASPNYATRSQVKIKVNSGAYVDLTADQIQLNSVGYTTYHCFKDVTSIAKAAGANARYTIANAVATVGATNKFGGWTIVIVYKNDLQPMRNLTVFNGLTVVSASASNTTVPISGFLTPLSGPVSFELGSVTYDGDRSQTGDAFSFNGAGTNVNITDAVNPANDVFNSTLSYNGVQKTAPFVNPAYPNTLGYDADIFTPNNSTKNYIGNSSTSANIVLSTGGETYLTQVVTLAIDVYEPDLRSSVRVSDINGGLVEPGDILEYTVTGKNIGSDPSVNTYIVDTLEGNAAYVPGSLRIVTGPNAGTKTDAASDDQAEYFAASRTIRVRIGTGANGISGGQVNNSPSGTDSTVFVFRVSATTDCVVLACDNVIDNRSYIYGTGNVSGTTFNNASNPDIFDGNGCPVPGSTPTPINAVICAAPVAGNNGPLCPGTPLNLTASASSNVTYSWAGPSSFTSTVNNPTINNVTSANAGSYTVSVRVPGSACLLSVSTTVTVTTPPNTGQLAGTAGGGAASQTKNVSLAGGLYTDPSCDVISRTVASGAAPVSGSVNSKVWVETTVPAFAGLPFVSRHYDIAPAASPSTSTGTVTLYFLQSEFNAFNAAAGSTLKMPTGPADAAGIANIRVGQFQGTSTGNTGLPGSYPAGGTVINPPDANIVWNASIGRWEITFPVVGFGGFILQTSPFVLPVNLVYFTGEKQGTDILLKWQTAGEQNSAVFEIEHSTNGVSFNKIGEVTAAGNSTQQVNYLYTHYSVPAAVNYYRLKQVDTDGKFIYSSMVAVAVSLPDAFKILVNPVIGGRLQLASGRAGVAVVTTLTGQVVKQQRVIQGIQEIAVQDLKPGVYLIRIGSGTKKFIIK